MSTLPAHFLDSRDFARIAQAIRYVDEHFREQPRLAAIASLAGLSEFHFNRLFRRWAGVTPKQYLAYVTGTAAKGALRMQPSVLDAAYSVGLSGPSRLHDLIVALDGVTPGELKSQGAGILIRYGFTPTPFGTALIAATARGVCRLSFLEPEAEAAATDGQHAATDGQDAATAEVPASRKDAATIELRALWPHARLQKDDRYARELASRIWDDVSPSAPLAVHVAGTNFQLKVWQALLELGSHGATTYSALAEAIGNRAGMRAVGSAVGANPVGWLIPCHNVLRKDGALGGYHWGSDRKRAMQVWGSAVFQSPRSRRQQYVKVNRRQLSTTVL